MNNNSDVSVPAKADGGSGTHENKFPGPSAPRRPNLSFSEVALSVVSSLPRASNRCRTVADKIQDKAAKELATIVDSDVAVRTIRSLVTGLPRLNRRPEYLPATTNAKGCWLSSVGINKTKDRPNCRPVFDRVSTIGVPVKERRNSTVSYSRRSTQFANRMSVRAFFGDDDIEKMVGAVVRSDRGKWEVSHLCSVKECFNPRHLVVESHSENEGRKHCRRGRCIHIPKCIT